MSVLLDNDSASKAAAIPRSFLALGHKRGTVWLNRRNSKNLGRAPYFPIVLYAYAHAHSDIQ